MNWVNTSWTYSNNTCFSTGSKKPIGQTETVKETPRKNYHLFQLNNKMAFIHYINPEKKTKGEGACALHYIYSTFLGLHHNFVGLKRYIQNNRKYWSWIEHLHSGVV